MADEVADLSPPSESPADQPWQPSPALQSKLSAGALAVIVAAALSLASSGATWVQGDRPGFTLAVGLSWAAALTQVGVLIAYLGLAKEADSDSLRRSSLGGIVALWLFQALFLPEEVGVPEPWSYYSMIGIGIALVILLIYVLYPLVKGAGIALFLIPWIAFRLGRGLVRQVLGVNALEATLALLVVLAFVALVVVHIWFSITLIRLRGKLGGMAAVAGWAQLLGLAANACLLGWLVAIAIDVASQPGMDERQFEELIAGPQPRAILLALTGVEVLVAAVIAWFFLAVRGRRASPSPLAFDE